MQKNIYYINLGENVEFMLENLEQSWFDNQKLYLHAIMKSVKLKTLSDMSGICSNQHVYLEGQEISTQSEWLCYCVSFPIELRAGIATLAHPTDIADMTLSERIAQKYEDVLKDFAGMLQRHVCIGVDCLAVMRNLSFGDVCVLCSDITLSVRDMVGYITTALKELNLKYTGGIELDTPDETITAFSDQIKKRFYSTYLIKLNANYTEYEELTKQMMETSVGSNDRKMYILMLCALLLRTILDESAARWVYESGETKYESLEFSTELTRAYELRMSGFREFLNQASVVSPYSDQIWSLFFITKTLLSSIVGRDSKAIESNCPESEDLDKAELLQEYVNFFGFVPYIGDRYPEVTSYYPSHISPDYCYSFLSIPRKESFRFWSYFPAYIHEFFHYVPPRGRKERNQKILHLAVYSVMNPLLVAMTSSRKAEYERIVEKIAFSVDQLRENLIDLRNDRNHALGKYQTYATRQSVENYRDTMKYTAIMQDLVYLLDFEALCTEAVNECRSLSLDASEEVPLIPDREKWLKACLDKWDRDMTSYITTFSFAMREIRSDLSMCVILDMSLHDYIKVLADEPSFAESSQKWIADSTVLRFGFMTRLLYTKELYYDSWEAVQWQELCKYMTLTCIQNISNANSTNAWKSKCCDILQRLRKEDDPLYNEYLEHLCDYLITYIDISVLSEDSIWDSVFEKAMCTEAYALSSNKSHGAENIDRRLLIPCWGDRLQKQKSHSFIKLICDLYHQYQRETTIEAKCRIEYQSRLLFRDLLLYFEDIDLPQNERHGD